MMRIESAVRTTSVPAVQKELQLRLTNALRTAGEKGTAVNVTRGANLGEIEVDEVNIGDIEDGNIEIATMKAGRKHREESFVQCISFYALRAEPEDAVDAVYALVDQLVDLLAETPGTQIAENSINVTARFLKVSENQLRLP